MSTAPIHAVDLAAIAPMERQPAPLTSPSAGYTTFSQILNDGLESVSRKVTEADALVREFTLDGDSVPIHQVTYALEQARLSVELMLQVRDRLVEGYQEVMRMQL